MAAAVTVKPITGDADTKAPAAAVETTPAATPTAAVAAAGAAAAGAGKPSRMRMDHITFTGADDQTKVDDMFAFLSAHHSAGAGPRIEIGFLVSRPDFGSAKYPSKAWIESFGSALDKASAKDPAVRRLFSVHVCNDWAMELAEHGSTECFEHVSVLKNATVQRVQLNFSRWIVAGKLVPEKLFAALEKYPKLEFIFQLPNFAPSYDLVTAARKRGIAAFGFFDPSAGTGLSPKNGWPKPPAAAGEYPAGAKGSTGDARLPIGFAGGLGPANLLGALDEISGHGTAVAGASAQPFWVDMETNVRTAGAFDLQKVLICVNISKPFF